MKSNVYHRLAVIFLLAAAAVAQQPTVVTDPPATRKDMLHLFEVMHVREQMRSTVGLIMQQQQKLIRDEIKQRVPEITEKELSKMQSLSDEAVQDLPLDGMLDDTIPVYQKHLSKADVDAMIAFYSTPTGKKLLREQPAIAAESMQAMGPRMQKAMSEIMDRIAAKAKAEAEKDKSPAETPEQRKN